MIANEASNRSSSRHDCEHSEQSFIVPPQNSSKFQVTRSRSFGLVEVLIAGVLVITFIGASVSLRQRVGKQSSFSRHQAVAYMLAQEGIEATKQIRDTNYLLTQPSDPLLNTSSRLKMPWNCDLTKMVTLTRLSNTNFELNCDQSRALFIPANSGDFSYTAATNKYATEELGRGMQMGAIFHDQAGNSLPSPYSSWHLSTPNPVPNVFDGSSGAAPEQSNMKADQCLGAERVFVNEGTLASGDSLDISIKSNKRFPGEFASATQLNYVANGSCTSPSPVGYTEYKRQVVVSPVTDIKSEGRGNLPAAWVSDPTVTTNHIARVLVRVSWQESNRLSSTPDTNAVLLTTYLTDWRPAN